MNYRVLGNSGLSVSEICFGVMTFTGEKGWTHLGMQDQAAANELTDIAIDSGVNFFDTADNYSDGVSEEMLGRALAGKRSRVIIGTKCGFSKYPGPDGKGLTYNRVIEACNESLKRLNTDYIDLYQIHSYDFIAPLEETLSAFNDLVKQGKIRFIGVSNFTGWQLMKAICIMEKNGWARITSLQPYYSLLGRDIELELVPLCLDQNLGIIPWGPLHGGILTGKYRRGKEWPQGTRIKAPGEHFPYDEDKAESILDKLRSIADERKVTVTQAALNYLLRKRAVTALIVGARNKEQLKENINTSLWTLSEEEVRSLDVLSEPHKSYPHWYFDVFRKIRNHF